MLSVLQLGLVLFLLLLVPLLLGLIEIAKVTLPVVESLRVLVDDIGRDSVKERSVVRADDQKESLCEKRSLTRPKWYQAMSADSLRAMQWR
jgi:hypothetical protein